MRSVAFVVLAIGCHTPAPASAPATSGGASTPATTIRTITTLAIDGFEPPFEDVPLAAEFVRSHHVVKVWEHQGPVAAKLPMTAFKSTLKTYDTTGRLVQIATLSADHDYAVQPFRTIVYVTDAETEPAWPAEVAIRDKVVVAANGRVLQRFHRASTATTSSVDTLSYDTAGRLQRTEHDEQSLDDHTTLTRQEELRTYDTVGHLIARTIGDIGKPPTDRIEAHYDTAGRATEWISQKPGYELDRYTFAYDPHGQLHELAFEESGKPIYRRTFTYDAAGFLIRIDEASFVPAMGDGSTTIAQYTLADGTTVAPLAAVPPSRPPALTDADVIAAMLGVMPAAQHATVTWLADRHDVDAITFWVPTKDAAALTATKRKDLACKLRNALHVTECDCETLELGERRDGAVQLRFKAMLGC